MAKNKVTAEELARISFRILDHDTALELANQASALGISRHEYARDLVTAGMTAANEHLHEMQMLRTEILDLRSEMKLLRQCQEDQSEDAAVDIPEELLADLHELACNVSRLRKLERLLRKLRIDHATGVNVLLPNAGQLTPAESRSWVKKNLLQE